MEEFSWCWRGIATFVIDMGFSTLTPSTLAPGAKVVLAAGVVKGGNLMLRSGGRLPGPEGSELSEGDSSIAPKLR